jgi:hypothetical protein
MDRTIATIWDQQNYPQTLGSGPATIANSGCYLCSFAMLADYYGQNVDPVALNTLFTQQNIYVDGDDLTDNALQEAYSSITYLQSYPYANVPADLGQLQTLLSDLTQSVILEVNSNPEGPTATLETHFVVAVSCDGTNVTIADPWTGQLSTGTPYGDWATTIQKYVVYKGTPTAPPVSVPSATFTTLVTKSTAYDAVCTKLAQPEGTSQTAIVGLIAQLQLDISNDTTTIANLNKQIPLLEGQVSTLNNQVTSLTQQLANAKAATTEPASGINYQTLYLQAEQNLAKASSNLQTAQATITALQKQVSAQKPATLSAKLKYLFS